MAVDYIFAIPKRLRERHGMRVRGNFCEYKKFRYVSVCHRDIFRQGGRAESVRLLSIERHESDFRVFYKIRKLLGGVVLRVWTDS